MINNSDDTPEARFNRLNTMATSFFETPRWRTMFAARYGMASSRALSNWRTNGPPAWALVAIKDALIAKHALELTAVIRSGESAPRPL